MPLPLETRRLKIRMLALSDLQPFYERIDGHPDVMGVSPEGPRESIEESRKVLERIIKRKNDWNVTSWAVEEKDTGELVGICGLIPVEGTGPEIELIYYFAKNRWGMGYATEASKAVLRYGFEELDISPIIAMTYPNHRASRRIMEKCGMKYVGHKKYYDTEMAVYSIESS